MQINPTQEFYNLLNHAFQHFNHRLFDNQLPWCMLTLQRSSNTMGYFSAERWIDGEGMKAHELALNPAYFARNRVIDVFQTLVHEQCHLWQHVIGKHKSRSGYHNKEWADKMEAIGLMPSSTGEAGGSKTGQSMSDYPLQGGKFLQASYDLCQGEYRFKWVDTEPAWQPSSQPRGIDQPELVFENLMEEIASIAPALLSPIPTAEANAAIDWTPPPETKSLSKSKYTCPDCQTNVWGKPGLNVICGDCDKAFVLIDRVKIAARTHRQKI